MANQTKLVRIRKQDYEKLINTKKILIENDIKKITGINVKLSSSQMFEIAANSTWDLGENYQHKILKVFKKKKSGSIIV